MTNYQLLIPEISILLGIFVLSGLQIGKHGRNLGLQWIVQLFFILLAFFQELLLYQVPSTLLVNGGMMLDGTTEILSLSVLILAIVVQISRFNLARGLTPQVNVMTMGMILFSLLSLQSNRILFVIISCLGLIWTTHGALAADANNEKQPDLVHSGMIRGLMFLVLGLVLTLLCFTGFGETQLDEIQKILVRGQVKPVVLFSVQIMILFIGGMMMGLPPFQGLFGKSRRASSWALALGSTGFFAVVGFNIFLRWGVIAFTRPAIGAQALEPLAGLDFLMLIRLVSGVALVLIPLLALFQRQLRVSLLYFALNPFAQALFSLSFGQRDLMNMLISQVLIAVVIVGLMISAVHSLGLSHDAGLQDWVGLGRRTRAGTIPLILALTAAGGMAPFYGSVLLQKTLSVNSYVTAISLLNAALSGFFVARMVILAFHRGGQNGEEPIVISRRRKLWFAAQLAALFFMGIFWQPLYKYGAFSIRGFFGEI